MSRTTWAGTALLVAALVSGCQSDVSGPTGPAGAPSLAIVDHGNGTMFVGKGDVQLFFGWNNKGLQNNAVHVDFRLMSSEVTSWTCTKIVTLGNGGVNEIVQQRSTTSSYQELITTQGRDISEGLNGPNTGFNLTLDGSPTQETDGPEVGSCPANPSGFTYDDNATTEPGASGLQIILYSPGSSNVKSSNVWYDFPG